MEMKGWQIDLFISKKRIYTMMYGIAYFCLKNKVVVNIECILHVVSIILVDSILY